MPDGRFEGACEKIGGATFRGKRGTGLTYRERRAIAQAERRERLAKKREEWWKRWDDPTQRR